MFAFSILNKSHRYQQVYGSFFCDTLHLVSHEGGGELIAPFLLQSPPQKKKKMQRAIELQNEVRLIFV